MPTRVLLTGATGFVGQTMCDLLAHSHYQVRAALRVDRPLPAGASEKVTIGEIAENTDWSVALEGVDCVMHIAARAHVRHDARAGANLYVETNANGTRCLANAAAELGVRRFVYLSSVKVNGEGTAGHPYSSGDEPHPSDAYGVSKWLGEKYLMEIATRTDMECTIVRSPLVYGPGVRANFFRLMQWVENASVLPLGAIDNSRSLVSIWNLCDLLINLLENPRAPGRTWMVSDGEDLSTPELVRRIARALGRRVKLLPVPVSVLSLTALLLGRRTEIRRLCGSLVLDIAPTRSELNWSPPITVDEGLNRTVRWYLSESRSRGN